MNVMSGFSKRLTLFGLVVASTAALTLVTLLLITALLEARQIRAERSRVHRLIEPARTIEEAESILRDAGYKLAYDEPLRPTQKGDYLQQLVKIGDAEPSVIDSIAYVTGWPNPFYLASPYVVIDAETDGTILRID